MAKLLSGAFVLFISMTVVNAGNYLYNLVLGRWLGPVAFADLSLIVTLMLMLTFATATLQLAVTKFVATYSADSKPINVLYKWFLRVAWRIGILAGFVLVAGALYWQSFFNTASPWPFVILGLGIPVYFVQGVDRGVLQGETQFKLLAATYVAEMIVRLSVGLGIVALGGSVSGATAGISLSFLATWLVAREGTKHLSTDFEIDSKTYSAIIDFAKPVIVLQLSQILINNSDVLIVKRFFEGEEAGLYAALALIGRVVFFATWSVVMTLFPVIAQKHQKQEDHLHLLKYGVGLILLVSTGIVGTTLIFPDIVVRILFGVDYLAIAPMLWIYALATTLYALANFIVNYMLAIDRAWLSKFALTVGVFQIISLWTLHYSLTQIVITQVILMLILLTVALLTVVLDDKYKQGL